MENLVAGPHVGPNARRHLTRMFRCFCIVFCVLSPVVGQCKAPSVENERLERVRATGVIHVGYRPGAVPFSYKLESDAKPIGYAIDICMAAIEQLQKSMGINAITPVFIPVDAKARFAALETGEIDMECANTTVNLERRARGYAFSIPYFVTGSRTLVRKGTQAASLRTMQGKRVALIDGTSTASHVLKNYPQSAAENTYMLVKNRQDAFDLLVSRRADVFVEDDSVTIGWKSRSGHGDEFEVVGQYLTVEPFAVMFMGSEPQLKSAADRALRDLMKSGALLKLHQQWFQRPIPPKAEVLGMPMSRLMKEIVKMPSDDLNAYP